MPCAHGSCCTRTKADTRERLRRRRSELADVLDEVNTWLAENADTR